MSASSTRTGTVSHLELAEDLFTEELVVHLLHSEEVLRKSSAVQELYRGVRERQRTGLLPGELLSVEKTADALVKSYQFRRTSTYVLEDDLQRLVLVMHGVPDVRIRLQIGAEDPSNWTLSDPQTESLVAEHLNSDALLKQFRSIMKTYIHRPNVKQAAFYLKNNIMVPGYQVGEVVDISIPLYTYSVAGVEDERHTSRTLGELLQMAHKARKRRLVILAGSIT